MGKKKSETEEKSKRCYYNDILGQVILAESVTRRG